MTNEVVNILTGELIEADDYQALAQAWASMQEYRLRLSDAMRGITEILVQEAARRGSREIEGLTVEQKTTYSWQMPSLEQLLAAGLPQDKWDEIVTPQPPKVDARKMLAVGRVNPEYQSIIEGSYEADTKRYVKRKPVNY